MQSLKPRGVARMHDNPKAVLVMFDQKPSDDELRALSDFDPADAIKSALERDHLALTSALHRAYGPTMCADILSKIAYARNTQPRVA